MVNLKNISVGFLVSFVGSIPLGYLNIVGYEIYSLQGITPTINYLSGVIIIEFFVIYLTMVFAERLMQNRKLLRFIEAFSIVFMFVLAYVFYASASSGAGNKTVFHTYTANSFLAGIILSCLNFIQVPFWLGWNLYLLNGNYIEVSKARKYFYLTGTVIGTFSGMLALILALGFLTSQAVFLEKYLMKAIIPLVFAGLGVFQAFKFYKKYGS